MVVKRVVESLYAVRIPLMHNYTGGNVLYSSFVFRLLFIQSISTLCLAKLAYNFHIPFSYDFEAEDRPKDTCET